MQRLLGVTPRPCPRLRPPLLRPLCVRRTYAEKPENRPSDIDNTSPVQDPSSSTPDKSPPSSPISKWEDQLGEVQNRIRTWSLSSSEILRERANVLKQQASSSLTQVGGRLNEVTGYNEIEQLKRRVVEREREIASLKGASREAKIAYEQAVSNRSACQRQVNDLLQRKSSWNDADVVQFTALVRQDHINEQEEARAKERAASTEHQVETEFNELMRAILNRYHEEQIWSDKIRSASTYGSLAVIGLNLMVFILAIVVVEPWKRKRLSETFEKKIEEIGRENQELVRLGMLDLNEHFDKQERILGQLAAVSAAQTQMPPAPPTITIEPAQPPPSSTSPPSPDLWPTPKQIELATAVLAGIVGGGLAVWSWVR